MDAMAAKIARELENAARQAKVPFSIRRFGSLMNVFFTSVAPPATIVRDDLKAMAMFHLAALNRGLFIAPRGLIAMSTVITEALAEEICDRASQAMIDVAQNAA
jgi:glutamate-1-semialdehyde aminotransferase